MGLKIRETKRKEFSLVKGLDSSKLTQGKSFIDGLYVSKDSSYKILELHSFFFFIRYTFL